MITAWPLEAGEDWRLVGLRLDVAPAQAVAVKGVPFTIGFDFSGDFGNEERPELPPGWKLMLEYNAPGGGATTYQASLDWEGTIRINPGDQSGNGSLNGWRLVDSEGAVMRLFDKVVAVTVIEDVIVPQVEIKRLSYEEMRALGIVLGDDNYTAVSVEVELEIKETNEFLDARIVLIKDENTGRYTPIHTGGEKLSYSPVSFSFKGVDARFPTFGTTGIPPVSEKPNVPRPMLKLPQIDAVVIWSAQVGYLNSFFKPTLAVLNVAPGGTPYRVEDLRATIGFPAGALELARLEDRTQSAVTRVFGPGPDGIQGTPDDEDALEPQEKGFTSWILEGKRPGEHALSFDIRGILKADDGNSYPITGEARGFIYVRPPKMSLHMDFPSAVRQDDNFQIDAIFDNLSDVPVYDLSFAFDEDTIQGAVLNGTSALVNGVPVSGPVHLENKGDQAIFRMDLIAMTTGRVIVHDVRSDGDFESLTYSVKVAVGEHGLPVSTMGLLMPKALQDGINQIMFPDNPNVQNDVYTLTRVVAGRAISLAQVPPGEREGDLGFVSHEEVKNWIQDLTYAVLKPRMGTIEEQARTLARDFFLATLSQSPDFLAFLDQDSKFRELSDWWASFAGDLSDIPTDDLLIGRGVLLVRNQTLEGARGRLILGDPDSGAFWTGYRLDTDFDSLEFTVQASGLVEGFFYPDIRWRQWTLAGLPEGRLLLVWNGSQMEFVHEGARVTPTWTPFPETTPQLTAVRQMGYETVASGRIDRFGRQLLLYFSEPVVVDDDFVRNLDIPNNWVTRAEKVRDQIVQIWARNPLGLVDRDLTALPGIITETGRPVEPIEQVIHMSDYWNSVTVEGRVFGEDGEPLAGAEIGLMYLTKRFNYQKDYTFSGKEQLEALGFGEFARQVNAIIEKYGREEQELNPGVISYPFEFQTLTGEDGRYLMENWSLYRLHSHNILEICPEDSKGGPHCVDERPDLKWTVAHGDRRVVRRIYGSYDKQRVVRDFIFPAQGSLKVHIPALPDNAIPGPTDVVQIQIVDQDEFFFDRVTAPGETITVSGIRLGPVSILAKAIGGFDARSIQLSPETDGTVVTLDPATLPGQVTAQILELDEFGNEIPATRGFLLAYHYGAEFGGQQGKLLAAANLSEIDDGRVTMDLPEGTVRFDYARALGVGFSWKTVEVVRRQSVSDPPFDLGTFLYRPRERGEVTVLVTDTQGQPKANLPVILVDGLTATRQETDENGTTLFKEVVVGRGKVIVPRPGGGEYREFYTLSSEAPVQLSTTVHFDNYEPPFGLTVRAVDTDGQPITDVWVRAAPHGSPNLTQSAFSAGNGEARFEWTGIVPPEESRIDIEVQHPTDFRVKKHIFIRSVGQFEQTVEVAFPPVREALLTVFTADTLIKTEDVWIEVEDASGIKYAGSTDADGKVVFANLSPGLTKVTMLPPVEMVNRYKTSYGSFTLLEGDTEVFEQDLLLQPIVDNTIPDRIVEIEGVIFDAFQNPVDHAVLFELFLWYVPPGTDIPFLIPIGDTHATSMNGTFTLSQVNLPGEIEEGYTFFIKAYDPVTGNYGTRYVNWDRKTPKAFVHAQLTTTAETRVRVWDTYGNRMKTGSIELTQHRIINDMFDEDNTNLSITLTENDFTPTLMVQTGVPLSVTYYGPQIPQGYSENTEIFPHTVGASIDIIIKPLGSLEVVVNDETGTPLDGKTLIQIFKGTTLWTERVLDPDGPDGVMTFDEMPHGDWSVLAFGITNGYSDVWKGSLVDDVERATLNLLPGEDFTGLVLNTDHTPVAGAQLILKRGVSTLRFSNSSISGISNQELLSVVEEDGSFSFPTLTRGSYNLMIYDPFTNRRKNVSFRVPEVNDLEIFLKPVGKVTLTAKLDDGSFARGAHVIGFRNGCPVVRGKIDAGIGSPDEGTWTTPWMSPGQLTFLITSLDDNQQALVNTEILDNQISEATGHLTVIPYSPPIGFNWADTGGPVDERITVTWRWEAPGGVAVRTGRVIYPAGDPLPYRFMEGELTLNAGFERTLDHNSFSIRRTVKIDHSDEVLIEVQKPRILEVTVLDQNTLEPFRGVRVRAGRWNAAFTDNFGKVRFKNLPIGAFLDLVAVSDDGQYYGSGSVIIDERLVTDLTIAMHQRIGDASFEVTQLGDTYSKGLISLYGHGTTFTQVLDGNNIVNFRYLVEGKYSYTYLDPARGVRKTGSFQLYGGDTVMREIQVPGGGPLILTGQYEGGLPLSEGQVFQVRTPLKTFTAEIIDNAGVLEARWDAIPQGDWRMTTPTIPRSQWNPGIRIEHGVFNEVDVTLPFWVRADITFRDSDQLPISHFSLRRIRTGDGRVSWSRNFTDGFAAISLPYGEWELRLQPHGSPYSVSQVVNVTDLDQQITLDLALTQPTGTVKVLLTDADSGALVTRHIYVYNNQTGAYLGSRYANPFMQWSYLPASVPLEFRIMKPTYPRRPHTSYVRTLTTGYQEFDDFTLIQTPPAITDFAVSWNDNLPTISVALDREASEVLLGNLSMTYNASNDRWEYAVPVFDSPWEFGLNEVTVEVIGLHKAEAVETYSFQWDSPYAIGLEGPTTITATPFSLRFVVEDPGFEIDVDRLNRYEGEGRPSRLEINGRRVDMTLLPDGTNGVGVDYAVALSPWRIGENQVRLSLFDVHGVEIGMRETVILELPERGEVIFTGLDVADALEIRGYGPDGELTWFPPPGEEFVIRDLSFGEWDFRVYDEDPVARRQAQSTVNLAGPIAARIHLSSQYAWRDSMTFTVTLEDETGLGIAGIPITFAQYSTSATVLTDSEGSAVVDRISTYTLDITADMGIYQLRQRLRPDPDAPTLTLTDSGSGDILVRVTNTIDNGIPVANLNVYLNDELVGQTDAGGEYLSERFQAGLDFTLRVEGYTPDNGRIDETRAVTIVDGGLVIEMPLIPFFQGTLSITMDEAFDGLAGLVHVADREFPFPLTAPIELQLEEGLYDIRVTSRLGVQWLNQVELVNRNEITNAVLVGPQPADVALVEIQIQDTGGLVLADALVTADGWVLGRSDGEGRLQAVLHPGSYGLLTAHDHGSARTPIALNAGASLPVTIVAEDFSPRSVPNNVLWLTAERETLYLPRDNEVAAWVDLSGLDHHGRQTSIEVRPAHAAASPAGRDTLSFDGSDWLNLEAGLRDFAFGVTAFVVALPTEVRNDARFFDFGNGRQRENIYLGQSDQTDTLIYGVGKGGSSPQNAPGRHGYRLYEYGVTSVVQTGQSTVLYRDGRQIGSGRNPVPTTAIRTSNYVGRSNWSEAQGFEGEIAEILLFNRALNADELATIGAYLADKYGLYHPEARWIGDYAGDVQPEIHAGRLDRSQADRLVTLLASNPQIPTRGMSLWLKADAGVETDASGVIAWRDQSVNTNDATVFTHEGQPISSPQLVTGELGGNPVIRFTGGNLDIDNGVYDGHQGDLSFLELDKAAPLFNETNTTFLLVKTTDAPVTVLSVYDMDYRNPLAYRVDEALELQATVITHDYSSYYRRNIDKSTRLSSYAVGNSWALLALSNDNNKRLTARVLGNQTADEVVNLPDDSHFGMAVGHRWGPGRRYYMDRSTAEELVGDIAEILVYDRLLDESEILEVEAYMAQKYGLVMETPQPVFFPDGGVYTNVQQVTVTGVAGGTIHYTLDGDEPTMGDPVIADGNSLTLTTDTTLRARVFRDGFRPSPVTSATYVIGVPQGVAVIDNTKTIWTVGTTEQNFENRDILISGANVTVVGPHTFKSLRLINGAVLTHRSLETPGVTLTVTGDVTIDPDSAIDAGGLGYGSADGPGEPAGTAYRRGAGGGYGGAGGFGTDTEGGPAYGADEALTPVAFGSGGGRTSQLDGGAGGGRIRLDIGGDLILEGAIRADGREGEADDEKKGGGGSGGSVHISAATITGSGTISADGGLGYRSLTAPLDVGNGGGAGGRIALEYDTGLSDFPPASVHAYNGFGGAAEAGTVYVNGQPVENAQLTLRVIDKDEITLAGMWVRILHVDGRELIGQTDGFGLVTFTGLAVGEEWACYISDDAVTWDPQVVLQLTGVNNFEVLRAGDTIEARLRMITGLHYWPLDFYVNGFLVAENVQPNGYHFTVPVRRAQINRIEVFFHGWQTGRVASIRPYVSKDAEDNDIIVVDDYDNAAGWEAVVMVAGAADGGELNYGHRTGLRFTYIENATGNVLPGYSQKYNGERNWPTTTYVYDPYEGLLFRPVYLPGNGEVTLRYRYYDNISNSYTEPSVLMLEDELSSPGQYDIHLPYPVMRGEVLLENGANALSFAVSLLIDDADLTKLEEDPDGPDYRMVKDHPNDLRFEIDGYLEGTVRLLQGVFDNTMLVTDQDLVFESFGVLHVGAIDFSGEPGDSYYKPDQNGGWIWIARELGEHYSPADFPIWSEGPWDGFFENIPTDFAEPRTYIMPLGYWSVGGAKVAARSGVFTETGQEITVSWEPDEAPVQTRQINLEIYGPRNDLGQAYRVFAINETNYAHIHYPPGVEDGWRSDEMWLPLGRTWFFLTYGWGDEGNGGGGGEGEGKTAETAQKAFGSGNTWVIEREITEDDWLDGYITLDFWDGAVEELFWGLVQDFSIMPGLIHANWLGFGEGSGGGVHKQDPVARTVPPNGNVMAFGQPLLKQGNFFYSPIGWFGHVDTATGSDGEIAWRHKIIDLAGLIDDTEISVPLRYAVNAPDDSGIAPLFNEEPVTLTTDEEECEYHFFFNLPADASDLTISFTGGSGYAPFYLTYDVPADDGNWEYASLPSGPGDQVLYVPYYATEEGRWYLMIGCYPGFTNRTLEVSWSEPGGGGGEEGKRRKTSLVTGMNEVQSATGFLFGVLAGDDLSEVMPTFSEPRNDVFITFDPADLKEYEDSYYSIDFTYTLPANESGTWSFIFPMMMAPHFSDDDIPYFQQDYDDWKNGFDPAFDPFFNALPQSWRDEALNWSAGGGGNGAFPDPLSYWPLDLLGTTETHSYDIMKRHHGENTAVLLGTEGRIGEALGFNGTSSVDFQPSEDLDSEENVSVAAWVSVSQWDYGAALVTYGDEETTTFSLELGGEGFVFRSDNFEIESEPPALNQWVHVAAVYGEGTATLYLDGSPAASTTITEGGTLLPLGAPSRLSFGSGPGAIAQFRGDLDEVALWDVALSDGQVNQVFEQGNNDVPVGTYFNPPPAVATKVFTANYQNIAVIDWRDYDATNQAVVEYLLYESQEPMAFEDEENLSSALSPDVKLVSFSDLDVEYDHYYAVVAVDVFGNHSTFGSFFADEQTVALPYPVTYLTFDDEDTSSTRTYDILKANPGDLQGATLSQVAVAGESLSFDGSASVELPFTEIPLVAEPPGEEEIPPHMPSMTGISLWVTAEALTEGATILSHGHTGRETFTIDIASGGLRFKANWPDAEFTVGTDPIQTDRWYHLVAVFDNGTASIYLDGVLANSTNWGIVTLPFEAGATLAIGRDVTDRGTRFTGHLDELVFFGNTLTQTEVDILHGQGEYGIMVDSYYVEFDPVPFTVTELDNGTVHVVDWRGYDEKAQGRRLHHYSVYVDDQPFPGNYNVGYKLKGFKLWAYDRFDTVGFLNGPPFYYGVVAVDIFGNRGQIGSQSPTPQTRYMPDAVSYWTLDTEAVDETYAYDLLGRHHGLLEGAAPVGSILRGGLIFDGSDKVSFAHSAALDIPETLTVSVWVRPDTPDDGGIISYGEPGLETFSIHISGGMYRFQSGTDFLEAPRTRGRWSNLVAQFDHGHAGLYQDGVLIDEADWSVTALPLAAQGTLSFGNRHTAGDTGLVGRIDEIGIWNTVLDSYNRELLWVAGDDGVRFYDFVPDNPAVSFSTTADNGTTVILDWSGYGAGAVKPVDSYRVYLSDTPFTDVSQATLVATQSVDNEVVALSDLIAGNTYHFAVVAIDFLGLPSALETQSVTINALAVPEPILHYDMESVSITGTTLGDATGQHHAVATNAMAGRAGIVGSSLEFRASGSATASATSELDATATSFTLATWVNVSSFTADGGIVGYLSAGGTGETFSLTTQSDIAGGWLSLQGDYPATPDAGLRVGPLAAGTWYHLAATVEAGQVLLYLNGLLVGSDDWGLATLTLADDRALILGTNPVRGQTAYDGFVDELGIWDTALSAQQIRSLYYRGAFGARHYAVPPREAGDLSVAATATTLDLSWQAPPVSFGDAPVTYNLYVDGDPNPIPLTSDTLAYQVDSLSPGSLHSLRLTTVDAIARESNGVTLSPYTRNDDVGLPLPQPVAHWDFHTTQNGTGWVELVDHYSVAGREAHGRIWSGLGGQLGIEATSYYFDGINNRIQHEPMYLYDLNGDEGQATGTTSISIWARVEDFHELGGLFATGRSNSWTYALTTHADRTLGFSPDEPAANVPNPSVIKTPELLPGTWHHIALTFDEGTASLYLDGVLIDTQSWSITAFPLITDTTADAYHGRNHSSETYYQGWLDEHVIWDVVLTPRQINLLYHGGSPTFRP
ncbi:MAG: chitobiase/beta-hexosaminidase C-terminal domain-containing protein [Acidobacteriota bacterium]|nr:chitobiase/beta-hexosaminidase C-terminal domain-containing protein [Acidobacteriota bacterium]